METTKLLKEREAAQYLNLSVATLRTWRSTHRTNLRWHKLNRAVRYRISDLEAFLQSNAVEGRP